MSRYATCARSTFSHEAMAHALHFDGLAPGFALAGVGLAEIVHLALRHAAVTEAARLDDAPILVDLAVLLATLAAQEHAR